MMLLESQEISWNPNRVQPDLFLTILLVFFPPVGFACLRPMTRSSDRNVAKQAVEASPTSRSEWMKIDTKAPDK